MRLHRKTSRRSRVAVFCFVLALIGGLWWISQSSAGWGGRVALMLALPLRYVVERGYILTRAAQEAFQSRQSLMTGVAQLKKENQQLRDSVGDKVTLEAEVRTLREVVKNPVSPGEERIIAHVSGKGAHFFGRTLLIDRGSDSGVVVGDVAVASSQQVVGLVERVGRKYAWVKLLGHREFRAAVKVVQLDVGSWQLAVASAEGLVRGEGFGNVALEMVPADALLKEGDLVLTSGSDGLFPPNLVIGKVLRVTSVPSDFFQRAGIAPAVDIGGLEVVTILSKSQ